MTSLPELSRLSGTGAVSSSGNNLPTGAASVSGAVSVTGAVQEKLNEYAVLAAPIEQAIREMHLAQTMLRARAEDEINALSPALAALADALNVSTVDLLTAPDRETFLRDAVNRSGISLEQLRRRVFEAETGAPEQLRALGLLEAA